MLMTADHELLPALLQLSDGRPAISILGGLAGNRKIRSTKQKRHSAKAEWRRYLNQAALDRPLLSYPSLNWLVLAGTGYVDAANYDGGTSAAVLTRPDLR